MPSKKTQGSDQGRDISQSRSAQSGQPDDKPRDSTQRGDQGGQPARGGNQREKETKRNAERRARSGRNKGDEQ